MTDLIASHNGTGIDIQADEIACRHDAKMSPKGVHPYVVLKFWVSNTDMTGYAFCEALSGEITKDTSSVDEDMAAVLFKR
jgi:hypothetical protein